MKRDDLKAIIQGPFTTVPTAFDDRFILDLGVMADLTRWWVDNGCVTGKTVIKLTATLGEGYALSDDEWPQVLRAVVDAADGKAAIVCGLKAKDTLHTVEDARRAQDLGAVGLQIALPIFHFPTQDDIVRYFAAISDAIEIGIVIYNTWWYASPSISADSVRRLADAEYVVAVKWDVPPDSDYDEMRQFAAQVNVIDNSNQPARCHRNGGRGYITNTMPANPTHDLDLWQLLEAGRYDEFQVIWDRVNKSLAQFMATAAQRSGGDPRVPKGMMAIMGHPMGPPRPPTLPLDSQEMAALRDLLRGFGWSMPAEAEHGSAR